MRTPLIAGNWKMNLSHSQAVALARDLAALTSGLANVEIAVCPSYVYLEAVRQALQGSAIGLGAQNMHAEPKGAFTGEISAAMLLDLGCKYVILGHSERRHGMGETDEVVNKKLVAALKAGLKPILCVGELLSERDAGQTHAVIEKQLTGSLANISAEQLAASVLAYEPVWAIGTGRTASPEQAEEVHSRIRTWLAAHYNAATADSVRILYGGSVTADKSLALFAQPNIDGGLVGGASLQAPEFTQIIQVGARSR